MKFRESVYKKDAAIVRQIVASTGFFSDEEINIAEELVLERFQKGIDSGYYFIFAENEKQTLAYSCYGPIPGTKMSYDLYWIAVHNDFRGKGIGKQLLQLSEQAIYKLGGRRIYIETSSRDLYIPTREFYLSCQYKTDAILEDFYAPGDSKYIFVKKLA